MRRLIVTLNLGAALFAGITIASCLIRSDGITWAKLTHFFENHGLLDYLHQPEQTDGIVRTGWPLIFLEKGGFAYIHRYSPIRLGSDIAFSVAVSFMIIKLRKRFDPGRSRGH